MWHVNSVVSAYKEHQSELYSLFEKGIDAYNTDKEEEFIEENYSKAENISVDNAIMETSDNVYVLPAEFDWNDLGTWVSLYDKLETDHDNNAIINAKTLVSNSKGNIIRTNKGKLVVIDGMNDYIIVDKDEALLIYPKEKEQNIREVLKHLKQKFGKNFE